MFKWLFVGDLQIPYQDDRAVKLWLKILKSYKPDAVDIVGDIDDLLEFSRYSDGTTDEFFNKIKKSENESPVPYVMQVSENARQFYHDVRSLATDADIFAALGNHEDRVFQYMDKKAPQFATEITPDSLWDLKNLGIDYAMYQDPPTKRFGDVYVHHGATTSSSGLAVKSDIENYGVSLVRGHDHLGGVVMKTYPMIEKTLIGVGTGHLCKPGAYGLKYTINPAWQLGFASIEIDDSGNVFPEFHRISPDYTCSFKGKLFKG